MTKYNIKNSSPIFFQELIQELPSFKSNITIQASDKTEKLNNDLDDFLNKIYQIEKNAIFLVGKIEGQLKDLTTSLSELRSTFLELEKVKFVSKKYNMGYESEISSSYPKMADYMKVLESHISHQTKFFDSSLVRYMKYQHFEYKNFSEYMKRSKWVKDSLKNLQSSLSTHDKSLNEKINNIKIFRAFVNQITHYNFKQFYITKNQKISEKIDKVVGKYASFLGEVG